MICVNQMDRVGSMTQRERFLKCLNFEKVDHIPNMEFGLWNSLENTLDRWHQEGCPWWVNDMFSLGDHLGMDKSFNRDWMKINNTYYPVPEERIIESNEHWKLLQSDLGAQMKKPIGQESLPQVLKHAVEDESDYDRIYSFLNPDEPGRYDPELDIDIAGRQLRGEVCGVNYWGFFGTLRDLMGFEGALLAYYDQPELVRRIINDRVDMAKRVYKKVLSARSIDFVQVWEDMAYNAGPMVSPSLMREFMLEPYQELVRFFKENGVQLIMMDCDGRVDKIIPILLEAGINGLMPCEIAAGSDPVMLREQFPEIALMGGVDKRVLAAEGREGARQQLRRLQPVMQQGGFIPFIDHFIPPDISYDTFLYYVQLKQELCENPWAKI